jgi:mannose-6-phosphate isomerase-like protein (cupin superfamily)
MRRILTGVDVDGRSCIVEDVEVEAQVIPGIDGLRSGTLFSTPGGAPPAPPPQAGRAIDHALAPGALRWILVDNDPPAGGERPEICVTMHHQDAYELVFVVAGSTRLVLDADATVVEAGDCVVLAAVDHAFETGEQGCRMLAVAVGTPPRPAS